MTELVWDPRLDQRGVVLNEYIPRPDESYWKLIDARYLDPGESQGRHHILVDTWDEQGNRAVGVYVTLMNGGISHHVSEVKRGDNFSAALPMFAAGNAYSVRVGDRSDLVSGMSLGTIEQPNVGHHVSYRLIFQRTRGGIGKPPEPPNERSEWRQVEELAHRIIDIAREHLG